jgi:hypothetical protein
MLCTAYLKKVSKASLPSVSPVAPTDHTTENTNRDSTHSWIAESSNPRAADKHVHVVMHKHGCN